MNETELNILDGNISNEFIMFQHNFMKKNLERALQLVKEYIIDNDLMIVGGMAIDLALRVKDDKLYDENVSIPDYDIVDPNNVDHSNKIGTILCNNNFGNISIIPALHKTTVRVQMSGYTLFDATFVPEYIYSTIPVLKYKDIKFIHPIYQKIDQFISLSFLFDLTGAQYNIQHRLIKDKKRKELLNQYYNLDCREHNTELCSQDKKSGTYNISSLSINLNSFNNKTINHLRLVKINNTSSTETVLYEENNISEEQFYKFINSMSSDTIYSDNVYYSIDCDITYHGCMGYNLIYHSYQNMVKLLLSKDIINKDDKDYINLMEKNIEIKSNVNKSGDILSMDYYDIMPIVIINNNNSIDKIITNIQNNYTLNNIKNYENIAHKIPNFTSGVVDIDNQKYDMQIFDLYGKLLASNLIIIDTQVFNVANYNYILSYFLFSYYNEEEELKKQLYKSYYLSLLNIIKISEYLYDLYSEKIDSYEINTSWFKLSINTLGFKNYSENYYYFIKNFINVSQTNKNLDDLPPKNYIGFPDCIIKKEFDNENSPFYNKFHKEIKNTNFADELYELLHKFD
jgi:hypothetical protein